MSTTNRTTKITKLYSLLKKQYKAQPVPPGRNLFEHLLYACLLEDGSQDAADEGIARLEQEFFDWNEVRVTTVTELAETFPRLPNATLAASRLKKNLHAVFETYYSFDIEELKKQNLGKTIKDFSEFPGMSPFVLAYVVQQGLGGHAIPVNVAGLELLEYCGIINSEERAAGKVPGVERAIPKAKGAEFASLLHQASLEFSANPKDPKLHALILQLNPEAADSLPGAKKPAAKKTTTKKAKPADADKASENEAAKASVKKTAAPTKTKTATKSKTPTKSKSADKPKTATKATAKKTSKKPPTKKSSAAQSSKKTPTKSKSKTSAKSAPKSTTKGSSKAASNSRASNKRLAKKKPR